MVIIRYLLIFMLLTGTAQAHPKQEYHPKTLHYTDNDSFATEVESLHYLVHMLWKNHMKKNPLKVCYKDTQILWEAAIAKTVKIIAIVPDEPGSIYRNQLITQVIQGVWKCP